MSGTQTRRPGYESFVSLERSALVRTAWAITGDRQHAEDVVQIALARVWQRWDRIEGDPAPNTQRIVINLCRRRHGRPPRREDSADADVREAGIGPDTADAAVDRAIVARWLDRLPQRQRAVVVLRYLCDLSVDQTARQLGCSAGTVKSQASKALRRLQDFTAEYSEEQRHDQD